MIRNQPKRKRRTPATAWVGLAVEAATHDIIIASMSKTKADALLKASCRVKNAGTVEAFQIDDMLGDRIFRWLTARGCDNRDSTAAVREIGRQMATMFE